MAEQIPQNQIPTVPITDLDMERIARELRDGQNLTGALLAGLTAAVVGAILWAVISVSLKFQIGFMAIGVGMLVGFAVQKVGKGIDPVYGIIGGGFALLGCILGNFFTICGFLAVQAEVSVFEVFTQIDMTVIPEVMMENFGLMDVVFYAIAVYEGYKFAIFQRGG